MTQLCNFLHLGVAKNSHAILHKKLCVELGNIIEFELFDMTSQTEYDANVFQATLLIDEEELMDYLRDGNDVVYIAKSMNINVNLLLLKLNLMNEENSDYNFNLSYIPRRDFLGTIDDSAGEL